MLIANIIRRWRRPSMWQCPSCLKVVKRRGHGTPPTLPTPRSLPRDVDGWYSQTHIVAVQPTHRADPKSGFWWVYIYLIIYLIISNRSHSASRHIPPTRRSRSRLCCCSIAPSLRTLAVVRARRRRNLGLAPRRYYRHRRPLGCRIVCISSCFP